MNREILLYAGSSSYNFIVEDNQQGGNPYRRGIPQRLYVKSER